MVAEVRAGARRTGRLSQSRSGAGHAAPGAVRAAGGQDIRSEGSGRLRRGVTARAGRRAVPRRRPLANLTKNK
jgi:hypothetical protein